MKRERALTLIELLTVVVIVLLLLAIMLPVVLHFRKNAQKTHCINNLRQIGAAIQLYRADFGGTFPSRLSLLMSYIKTDEILVCPTEPAGNGMSAVEQVPTNYVTILRDLSDASASINTSHRDVQAAQLLMELDANHGVLVCVLHGRRVTDDYMYSRYGPDLGSHEGLILRLQADTSVVSVQVFYDTILGPGNTRSLSGWYVFSNVRPCPEAIRRLQPLMLNCPNE